jgi:hypothetical protein
MKIKCQKEPQKQPPNLITKQTRVPKSAEVHLAMYANELHGFLKQ